MGGSCHAVEKRETITIMSQNWLESGWYMLVLILFSVRLIFFFSNLLSTSQSQCSYLKFKKFKHQTKQLAEQHTTMRTSTTYLGLATLYFLGSPTGASPPGTGGDCEWNWKDPANGQTSCYNLVTAGLESQKTLFLHHIISNSLSFSLL